MQDSFKISDMATIDKILGREPAKPQSGGQSPDAAVGMRPLAKAEELEVKPEAVGVELVKPKPTELKPSEAKPAEVQEDKPRLSYAQLYELMNPDKPETPEQKAAREKKEKREAVMSAIGDGISALSNLFFTTKDAPNSYDPSRSMSAVTRARWDKLRAEREANKRIYNEGYLRALSMDEAREREDRNWRHTIERERIADRRYEEKAKRDAAMDNLNEQLKRHQITAAEYKAEQERIASAYTEALEKSKVERNRAAAYASNAKAAAEGRKESKEFSAWDKDGNEHKFKSKSAAIEFAKQHGTYKQDMVTNSDVVTKITPGRVDSKGNKLSEDRKSEITQTDTTKPGDGYAVKPEKKANPMGDESRKPSNGKKTNPMN